VASRGAQLDLFGGASSGGDVRPVEDPEARALAARLPTWVRLGTSSWTFPGWAGLVYAGRPAQSDLVASGLRAYAAHPLFRTVGIDRSHYAPLTDAELAGYAAQLPPGFLAVAKVWDEATALVFPRHARYGARAGTLNQRFLDPELVAEHVAAPWLRSFATHGGPLVLEVAPIPRGADVDGHAFVSALDRLLRATPRGIRYAVELRNRELLTRAYLDVLARHGAAHVLNYWTAMPPLAAQLSLPGVLSAAFVVTRLLLPPGTRYDDMREAFAPFDKIVAPQPAMRDDVGRIARACAEGKRELFVLVNNKAEGSSPLTVRALARTIVDALT
jgi:uncharacterized protein YecE (DUF72 family)